MTRTKQILPIRKVATYKDNETIYIDTKGSLFRIYVKSQKNLVQKAHWEGHILNSIMALNGILSCILR